MVLEMRQCIRCGSMFRPLELAQMCCTEVCSELLQRLPLGPALALAKRVLPQPPQRLPQAPTRGLRRGPVFIGARFVVFEWQIEQLARLLGPLIDNFGLDEWFFDLDARMASSPEIIPQRDGGQWLQAKTLEEAQRRGLYTAPSDAAGKQTSRLSQALASIKRGFTS